MRTTCACALACVALAGCTTGGSEAATQRDDTAGRRDSIAAVAAASMTEEQVIGLLERTHGADSALGAIGAARGSTSDIKDFGRMISREHHALRRDVLEVGRRLGLTAQAPRVPPDQPPAAVRQAVDSAPAGAEWDNAYIALSIAAHQAAMENTARALAASRSPETKRFIERSVPIIQKHLDKALSLQKAMHKASGDGH